MENLNYNKAVSSPEEINRSSRAKCVVPVTLGDTCLPVLKFFSIDQK